MNNKIALAIICAPTDRESELLDRLLSGKVTEFATPSQKEIDLTNVDSIAKSVDSIFVTITGENEKCEEVAKKYGAHISHFTWEDDFAKARNFNFSQVPSDYGWIVWFDADDVVRNPHLLKNIVKKCDEEAIDAVVMKYLFDFDDEGNCNVEHLKTRLVKNDGCVKWDALLVHEDFANTRQIASYLNKEVEVLHLTDPKRIENSGRRNLYLAELAVNKFPKDPRSYWNLANTYVLVGKIEEAVKIYLQFLEISNSDEERFLSWFRLSGAYAKLGKYDYAIESALEALSLRPWYPDAYFLLGEINYNIGKYRTAREFLETGLTKPIPETESIVWNPLDYTYNPKLMLAQTYFVLNQPREALKNFKECLKIKPKAKFLKESIKRIKEGIGKFDIAEDIYKKVSKTKDVNKIKEMINSVPEDMKYYPPIVSLRNKYFIKESSGGKDIAIYCGYTVNEWDPYVSQETGVGGSEEAIIQLTKRFAKAGYNVVVYANTPKQQEYNYDGVIWKPFMAWNHKDKQDILIVWRHPKVLDYDINADKIYVDMHDVVPPEEFNVARIKKLTKVMFKSQSQRGYYPNIPDNKCAVIPHGLDIEEFESQRSQIQKNPYHILNTSSPDRSLKTCMKIVRMVYERLPVDIKSKVKFSQYYGFDIWDSEFSDNEKLVKWKSDAIKEINELIEMGIMTPDSGKRISQKEITKKYLECGALLYPSEFFEIGFISGTKAMLGGCIPFTTNVFAQGEFLKNSILVDSEIGYNNWSVNLEDGSDYGVKKEEQINKFVDLLVNYFKDPSKYEEQRREIIKYAKNTFEWSITSNQWINEFINE